MALRYGTVMSGTYMGVWWIVRFICFLIGLTHPLAMILFLVSLIQVPRLIIIELKNYRKIMMGGDLRFAEALMFAIVSCFYAAMLTAAAHYIYFRFFDHGYVSGVYANLIGQLSEGANTQSLNEALDLWASATPIEITLQLMSNNVMGTWLLAIPLALYCTRCKLKDNKE